MDFYSLFCAVSDFSDDKVNTNLEKSGELNLLKWKVKHTTYHLIEDIVWEIILTPEFVKMNMVEGNFEKDSSAESKIDKHSSSHDKLILTTCWILVQKAYKFNQYVSNKISWNPCLKYYNQELLKCLIPVTNFITIDNYNANYTFLLPSFFLLGEKNEIKEQGELHFKLSINYNNGFLMDKYLIFDYHNQD